MNVLGVELRGNSIVKLPGQVPTLDHKLVYDTVKVCVIVISVFDQLNEVGPMKGRFGIQLNADVAERRLNEDFIFGIVFTVCRQYFTQVLWRNHHSFLSGTCPQYNEDQKNQT